MLMRLAITYVASLTFVLAAPAVAQTANKTTAEPPARPAPEKKAAPAQKPAAEKKTPPAPAAEKKQAKKAEAKPAESAPADEEKPAKRTRKKKEVAAGECCKTCKSGKPCGDTCISKDRECAEPAGCACAAK